MVAKNQEALIDAYLAYAEARLAGGDPPLEPMLAVDTLAQQDPEAAWPIVVDLIRRATSDRILAYIAAGPLEDLLRRHGDEVIDRVEKLAESDQHFRRALTGVWVSAPENISERIETLVEGVPRL